jgi:N-carbamoyl-L-amino-acid hydrolase
VLAGGRRARGRLTAHRSVADPERITRRLQELWEIASGPAGGADRPAYSAAEAEAMRRVAGWAQELGLAAAIDAHGNLWALPEGDGPVVTAGSHVDTVPDGGRYDGALGTVLGLELVADLQARDGAPSAGLLVCAAEEAPRFGAGTVGSRLLTGALSHEALAQLHDADGISAADALAAYLDALSGLDRIPAGEEPVQRLRAHAEIHVGLRFGPAEIGVVARVASPRRWEITLTGESGHAGEVGMDERHDALTAAAEIVLAVERAAREGPPETVATVGTLAVTPGAVSVIPGTVRLGLDMRGVEAASLDRHDEAIRAHVRDVSTRRSVSAEIVVTRDGEPVELDPQLRARALQAAGEIELAVNETWSGAGHDAQHVNGLAPALLLFVPLHEGQSHTPQEGAEIGEILQAATIAAEVLGTVAP